jgi:hypothetical protein
MKTPQLGRSVARAGYNYRTQQRWHRLPFDEFSSGVSNCQFHGAWSPFEPQTRQGASGTMWSTTNPNLRASRERIANSLRTQSLL